MKESQTKMDFDHFRLNSDKLLFLLWPAFNLQTILRELLMGKEFWYGLYAKAEKREI